MAPAEIFQVILARNNEAKLRFSDGAAGAALQAGGSIVLNVTDGCGGWWTFDCKSDDAGGSNRFCICGSGWRDFAAARIDCMVTLYKDEDEDFYRFRVRLYEAPQEKF